jgi:hypothetical protein
MSALPPILPWDTTRPFIQRSDAATDYFNAGCPVGYFAEVVPLGTPGSVSIGNPMAAVLCRSIESTTPDVLVADATEYAVENMTRYNAALLDAMPMGPGTWAVLGVIGLFIWTRMRGGSRRIVRSNPVPASRAVRCDRCWRPRKIMHIMPGSGKRLCCRCAHPGVGHVESPIRVRRY